MLLGTHFATPLPGGLHISPRPFPISHCHHIDKRAGSVVLDADRAGLVFWLGVRPSAEAWHGEKMR